MYLKSIEIHGFKSFANKIKFEFHNGITGIVGPNGSGKSNVADAVRWVLGEQKVKQLRGSKMEAITLDNSDHKLDVDYEEVTVSRRLFRSGESEYMINGTQVRLKDVNELFYDTGIGKEGYSIIGQGQIDQILSGKPEERRELFDEAAGIVKFKRRKNQALKKLDDENQNLVRVQDILAELERQVGPLEKQCEKAKKYLSEVTLETNENINNIDKNTKNNKNTVQDLNKSNLETNNKKDNITDNETTTKEDKEKVIKEQISKLNLKIIVNKDNPERKKSAYIISDNLKDIGIKNTIEELSIEDMNKALNEKNYDLALVGWELSLVPDATNILESIGYEDEKLTNYINSLKNATTESQISDIYKSIQKYVNENALFMSLVIRYDYIVTNRRIEGKISPNSFDIYEGITNLDIAK